MATCGNCTQPNQTVSHIRACYQTRYERGAGYRVDTSDPMPETTRKLAKKFSDDWSEVNKLRDAVAAHLHPKGKDLFGRFAITVTDEGGSPITKFYRVKRASSGMTYVDVQASDDLYPIKSPASLKMVLGAIMADPAKAAQRYGQELGECYHCGRTLTDETSRELGIGPVCRSK